MKLKVFRRRVKVLSEKLVNEMLDSLAHIHTLLSLLIGSELILVEGFNTSES